MGIYIQGFPVGFRSGQKGVTYPEGMGKESSVNIFLHVPSVTFPKCQKTTWLLGLRGGMSCPYREGSHRSLHLLPVVLLCWAHWVCWKLVSVCWRSHSTVPYP